MWQNRAKNSCFSPQIHTEAGKCATIIDFRPCDRRRALWRRNIEVRYCNKGEEGKVMESQAGEREREENSRQTNIFALARSVERGFLVFLPCLVILIWGVTWVSIRSKGRRSIYWIRLQRPSYNILIQRGKPEMLTKILEKQYPYIVYKISAFFPIFV